MANLKAIAESTGVCVETVSRVLNGKYKGRTKSSRSKMRAILKEAERLNYRPNNAARAMRTQSTGLIGVVIDESGLRTHPVFTEVLQGADRVMKEAGYTFTISSLNGFEEETLEARIFEEHLIDGMMLFDSNKDDTVAAMIQRIPNCVLVNTNSWYPTCCVRRDEFHAGQLAGERLKAKGYKNAFYFDATDYSTGHYSVSARLAGFEQGFSGPGLEITVLRLGVKDVLPWLAENRSSFTASSVVVASQNLRLFRLMGAFTQLDLRAGVDFGLVSLDDETGLGASFSEVTRVSFPRIQIGETAGKMMLDILAGQKENCHSTEIRGEWIDGETTQYKGTT